MNSNQQLDLFKSPPVSTPDNAQHAEENCRIYQVRITGTAPLVQNKHSREEHWKVHPADMGTMVEARDKAYQLTSGFCVHPAEDIEEALLAAPAIGAAKRGRLLLNGNYLELLDPGTKKPLRSFELYQRTFSKRNRQGNKVNTTYCYPSFPRWMIVFYLGLNEKILPVPQFRTALEWAGKKHGIGHFTPSFDGKCGTFQVTEFQEF